jgi:putative cardiolipin synthase
MHGSRDALRATDGKPANRIAGNAGWLHLALAFMVGALALGMAGCASLPPPVKAEAFSIPAVPSDPLVQVASSSASSEGSSSFRPMPFSRVSMDTRLALARHATRSLDLQYYLLQNDYTGRTLLRAVRDAAQRGVRVRILVDDLYTDSSEELLLNLAATPNVRIKVFNPFPAARAFSATKWAFALSDFARLNHRMHNKLFIADGAFAVAGGRNIADEYFFRSRTGNFIDFDLLVAGNAVSQLQAVYDTYWNSPRVYPLEVLERGGEDLEGRRRAFEAATVPGGEFAELPPAQPDQLGFSPFSVDVDSPPLRMLHGEIEAFADDPEKVSGKAEQGGDRSTVTAKVLEAISKSESDVLLVSPYFVPGEVGMKALQDTRNRGVKVTLITNTLSANDEPLASAAYARYRVRMLKMGVDLYEVSSRQLRANSDVGKVIGASIGRSHAKIVVLDGKTTFVGSMNMDLRSSRENTEMGMFVHSPELARDVTKVLSEIRSNGTYHLRLGPGEEDLQWVAVENGSEVVYDSEPEVGLGTRLEIFFLAPFISQSLL